jgi:hypothetical protein
MPRRRRASTCRADSPRLVRRDLLERDHELARRRGHVRALSGERKLADIVRVHRGDLQQSGASVLAKIQDQLRGVARLVQARDSIDILPAHRSDRFCRGRLHVPGRSRRGHKWR